MSRLNEYRRAEEELRRQLQQLEDLKADAGLQRELEFETKLRELLAEYEMDLAGAVAILDPDRARGARTARTAGQPERKTRAPRTLKVYTNPHNGHVIETKGGNHKLLKAWKAEHGNDVVEGWLA